MDIQTKTDIIHQKIYDFLLYIYPLLTAGYDGAELKERAENLQLRERQDL